MKFLKILTFLLAFSIEMNVHADLIQTPENCLKSTSYCVFKAKEYSDKEIITKDDATLSLQGDTTLAWQSENDFSLVKGSFFLKANQDVTVETPYGKITAPGGTQAIFEKSQGRVTIQTIFGKVLVHPLGNKKSIYVLEGYENYLAEVDQSMKAQTGIPKPILVESFLKTWAHLTDEDKEDFLNDVEKFKGIHEKAIKELSILNDQIVQREIASSKAEKQAQKARIQREHAAKEIREQMYYQHLLGQ